MDKLINFLPNFLRCNSNKKILKKLKDPLIKLKILSSLRDEMTENDIENTFLYSLPKEFSNYNGRSLKEFWNGSHSKGNIYETILDLLLQGELNIEVIRKKVESPLFGIYFNSSWLIPTIGLSNFIDGDIRIQNLNLKNFISRYKQMVIYKSNQNSGLIGVKEIIEKLTYHMANFFNLEDRGRIAPGFKADLVIINKLQLAYNPITTINQFNFNSIDGIVIDGKLVISEHEKTPIFYGNTV
jgi:N-acyl-D-aspartate/D-glutamate deacylase